MEYLEVEPMEKPEVLHLVGALTCRHHDGNVPRQKFDALGSLWDAFNSQRDVRKTLAGYFMAAECTHGNNGWHPHFQGGWSILVPKGDDSVAAFYAFRERLQSFFEAHAKEHGITVDWNDEWLQIADGSISQQIRYVFKTLEDGSKVRVKESFEHLDASGKVPDEVVNEVTMGAYKRSSVDMWDAPTDEFVSLADSTRGMRWFRVGGIWASSETEKTDEELGQEDDTQPDDVVAIMSPIIWNKLGQEVRHMLTAIGEDVRYSRNQVASAWDAAGEMVRMGMDQRSIRDTLMAMIGPPEKPEPSGNQDGAKT